MGVRLNDLEAEVQLLIMFIELQNTGFPNSSPGRAHAEISPFLVTWEKLKWTKICLHATAEFEPGTFVTVN